MTDLDTRIEALDRQRRMMVQANRYAQKRHRQGLAGLGYDAEQIERLLEPDLMGEVGFGRCEITKIRDKIRRLRMQRRHP